MRILLIDDDAELAAMLTEYLGAEGFEAGIAASGEEGIDMLRAGRYDAVLLDIMLPGVSGLEVLRRIRTFSPVPVIMLTARGDDLDRVVGLEAGADDYVSKPYFPRELVARVHAVLRRASGRVGGGDGEGVLTHGPLRMDPRRFRAFFDEVEIPLTATELSVLELLLRSPGEVVRKERISRDVLGRPHHSFDRSVDVHISNIRQKLQGTRGGGDLIETVRGIGYRLKETR